MKSKEFIIWLKGFLTGKEQLTHVEIVALNKQLKSVETKIDIDVNDLVKRDFMPIPNVPVNPCVEPFPNPDSTGCPYHGNCGLPTVWHGIHPPICTKCGKGGNRLPNITCDTTGHLNVKFDYRNETDHVTGDLNESQD